MVSEFREDVLISILRLTEGEHAISIAELAAFMDRPEARVIGMLTSLQGDGCVILTDTEASLTDQGLYQAREVRRKHHVMESFLINVLGMDHMSAHKEACKMEHTMSQDSMQRLCQVVGNNVDQDCSSCNNPCNTAIQIDTSILLADLPLHKRAKIAYLRSGNPEEARKLISMGFVPGRAVSVESRISENGPRVINLGESTVALDANYAKAIYVNVGD